MEQTWPQSVLWVEHKKWVEKADAYVREGDFEKSKQALEVAASLFAGWELLFKADERFQ